MNELQPIDYKEQRVLTTAQLADGYETDSRRISENFNRNRDRFKEGEHYFCLEGAVLREFKGNYADSVFAGNANKVYLWTEKGTLTHAKFLDTERAWEVYTQLVDTYFRAKEMFSAPKTLSEALFLAASLQKQIEEKQPLIAFAETAARSEDSVLIRELAKVCCKRGIETGEKRLYKRLREWGLIMPDSCEPYQEYVNRGYFEVIKSVKNQGEKVRLFKTTRVMPKGQVYIMERLAREKGEAQ